MTLSRRSVTAENARHRSPACSPTAAPFELGSLSLEDALQLVVLYAEAEDDKFDKAAVRWLGRLLLELSVGLKSTRSFSGAWGCWSGSGSGSAGESGGHSGGH